MFYGRCGSLALALCYSKRTVSFLEHPPEKNCIASLLLLKNGLVRSLFFRKTFSNTFFFALGYDDHRGGGGGYGGGGGGGYDRY